MQEHAKIFISTLWTKFRALPLFWQAILIIPVACAIVFVMTVGNMGLVLLGTGIALPGLLTGWVLGILGLVFGKAISIIVRERQPTD